MLTTKYRQRVYASYGSRFQDAGASFDAVAAARWGRAQLHRLRRWLPANLDVKVVDLACGGGKMLYLFTTVGYHNIEGVDISPDQVALSKQVVPAVTQGDVVEFLEARPGELDLITGFDIIEHFYKDEALRFLDAAFAALKPGGRLILQTPNSEGPWGAQHRYSDFTHEIGFNPNSLVRLLQLVGFESVEARECDPPPLGYSVFSTIRFALWQLIRLSLVVWNVIELGSAGERVLTRVFLASGTRPR